MGFGAVKRYVDNKTEKAISRYLASVGSGIRPELQPSRELQRTLTQPLHALAIQWLMENADEPTKQRGLLRLQCSTF